MTPDGKKALKLASGGDLIQWRPQSPTDTKFTTVVVTVAANHLKALISRISRTIGGGKTVMYTEGVDLTGVPDALAEIAHNPGNQFSVTRQADFVLENGAWKLQ